MSLEDRDGNQVKGDGDGRERDQERDSLASRKLSEELSNWRRRRTTTRPHRNDHVSGGNSHSEPARTIKVRGHETLVVRKPKIAPKLNPEPGEG